MSIRGEAAAAAGIVAIVGIIVFVTVEYDNMSAGFIHDSNSTEHQKIWNTAGSFGVNKYKYKLGEFIYFAGRLAPDQQVLIRVANPEGEITDEKFFSGIDREDVKFYIEPDMSACKSIYTKDQIIGKWMIWFEGINNDEVYFEIIDEFAPGVETDIVDIEKSPNSVTGSDCMSIRGGDFKTYNRDSDLDEHRNSTLKLYNVVIMNALFAKHNFENDFHPDDEVIVGQVVALMIYREKHAGTYNPTEAERRYHEFIMDFENDYINKPMVPDTAAGVDRALIDILGDVDHIHRAEYLYESFNNIAIIEHYDLVSPDEDFWGLKFIMSGCEYDTPDVDCSAFHDILEANRDLIDEKIEKVEKMINATE